MPSDYHNKNPQTRWLINNRHGKFWKLGRPRSRHCQIQRLVRTCFLGHTQPSFHCVPTWQRGEGALGVSFIKASIPCMRAPPSSPSQRPHFLLPSHWGLVPTGDLGGLQHCPAALSCASGQEGRWKPSLSRLGEGTTDTEAEAVPQGPRAHGIKRTFCFLL